jgi:TfoX/Sxy family transcriptional regulator of competence genes
MASDRDFVEYVANQAGLGSALTHRKMFGEYALYLNGTVIAFVCDNQVYVKPTPEGRSVLQTVAEHPPYPQAKPYFRLDGELDDRELLQRLFQVTARALPLPKPKPIRRSKSKAADAKL